MRRLIFLVLLAAAVVVDVAKAEQINVTSGGSSTDVVQEDEFDGGFSSLDGMLQWAIGHSDPVKLKETSEVVHHMSPEELEKRRLEIKELTEKLSVPSDVQLMQIAVNELDNSSLPLEYHLHSLQELLVLVEPIDNAIGLFKLGGFSVLIRKLNHSDPEIRTAAAWVIGKASQNNPIVQKQVLELGVLTSLMKMAKSRTIEEAIKALYAISALIRNNLIGQDLFHQEAGATMLQEILSNSNLDIRLHKKSVFLIADLAEFQLENEETEHLPFFSNRLLLKSVVDSMASNDLDLQEKALYAVKNLLLLRSTEGQVFKDFCKLNTALDNMRQHLQQSMAEENLREYAMDVESLRREVEQTFLQKLDKVTQVVQHDERQILAL